MSELIILGFAQSTFVWATRMAAAQKGVEHTVKPHMPHTPELNAIHPLGMMPAMEHGDVRLWESRAITLYIDGAFDGPSLAARDVTTAAVEEAWTSTIITALERMLVRRYLFAYAFPKTEDGSPDLAAVKEALPDVRKALDVMEKGVSEGVLLSSTFRLPDLWAIPILYYIANLPEWGDLSQATPKLKAALPAALERPAVKATIPPPL